MRIAKRKRKRNPSGAKAPAAEANGKSASFRNLKAFGLWADHTEAKDSVEFTRKVRRLMERGGDAH